MWALHFLKWEKSNYKGTRGKGEPGDDSMGGEFFLRGQSFRPVPVAYGGSQARGQIGAVAASLHHSHSHTGSELHL